MNEICPVCSGGGQVKIYGTKDILPRWEKCDACDGTGTISRDYESSSDSDNTPPPSTGGFFGPGPKDSDVIDWA